jgi:hypothetical protein
MGAMKELFMDRCQEWADVINDCYGIGATDEEVANEVWAEQRELHKSGDLDRMEFTLLREIEDESYTDTSPREQMANLIMQRRIGMAMPCYGHDDEYKAEFQKRLEEWMEKNGYEYD